MAEKTLWIVAALVVIIVLVVALLAVFGGQLAPFKQWLSRGAIQSKLCQQLAMKGCMDSYMPQLESEKSNIFYDEIGQSLRDRNNRQADVNRATFGEVCEYLGFRNFDECWKNCNCKTS
jgi:hypothetical protein